MSLLTTLVVIAIVVYVYVMFRKIYTVKRHNSSYVIVHRRIGDETSEYRSRATMFVLPGENYFVRAGESEILSGTFVGEHTDPRYVSSLMLEELKERKVLLSSKVVEETFPLELDEAVADLKEFIVEGIIDPDEDTTSQEFESLINGLDPEDKLRVQLWFTLLCNEHDERLSNEEGLSMVL